MSAVGRTVTFGETRDLMLELNRETGSHLHASLRGYDRYAMSESGLAQLVLAEAYFNVHRDQRKHREPYDFGRPWSVPDANADVTPERRAELVAALERRSAFR
ncbi:hypothetical protein [Agromyces larvae]|uniref:Uncharacterized protein n=1 Tax=Agromyces larvae TaxID=2929802 RepID=A0ABY4C1W3_9MICO|nr:hypothetical protein [Agromyces larvae]UOE45470.1 hypothetical protein MTO99_06855 [Agromyces larvae]